MRVETIDTGGLRVSLTVISCAMPLGPGRSTVTVTVVSGEPRRRLQASGRNMSSKPSTCARGFGV